MKKEEVKLKNNIVVVGDAFDETDEKKLLLMKRQVDELNKDIKSHGGRMINIPDVISEGLFACWCNAVRTNGVVNAGSYDCVMRETGDGVQVKSSQIKPDLTSFGPNSTWDKLFFMDFSSKDEVSIYEIPSEKIYDKILNKSKNETFRDQQNQGRRPRLSIHEIIEEFQIPPIKNIKI